MKNEFKYFSNFVRNISFNLMVPIPKINITRDTISKIHDNWNI